MANQTEQLAIVQQLERQIEELKRTSDSAAALEEIERLRHQVEALRLELTEGGGEGGHGGGAGGTGRAGGGGDAWARVMLARHPQRPYSLDYIEMLFTDFTELRGDRRFADDPAIVGGFARFEGAPVMVIGQQKGRDTKQKLLRNFGMANPEGYRKALRLMRLAAKFHVPIITLVDTPGAYPGIGAEERGQAEAIAYNLKEIPKLSVPIVVIIHGEGGSGGALAVAIGDQVLMFENAIYSVISPESCSSILWRDWDHKQEAARILKLTAEDLSKFRIIDQIVPEPDGGAHRDHHKAAELLRPLLRQKLRELGALAPADLLRRRHQRLRELATFVQEG
ncbi:MAG TPA: acetyl-CoA carboxylase carboxyltransferase subunit alpha [Terriglobia bacterium]|nr:acetyl-CoA carboxylase carboxyltransferase subunit alpha [Terriglobia bacterium]